MTRYQVILTTPAQEDIEASYLWGLRAWGKTRAQKWVREIRSATKELATFPERGPLAPENDKAPEEIRQLLIGRYRVLFTIRGKKVYVLHVRGAYADGVTEEGGEN